VTSLTGIDALAHAVETYVTKPRNAMSLVYSRAAWRLLEANFARVLSNPDDVAARSGMQLGACLAGLAIENSMLGATHALANPLTAHFGLVHGEAIGLMLPQVVRFNGPAADPWYHELLDDVAETNGSTAVDGGAEALSEFLAALRDEAGLPARLSACGVDRAKLPQLAIEAAKQWTASFNPRPIGVDDMLALYEQAF
jgi:alcohol dehydrogenase